MKARTDEGVELEASSAELCVSCMVDILCQKGSQVEVGRGTDVLLAFRPGGGAAKQQIQ